MILADPDHLLGEDVEIPRELREAVEGLLRRQRGRIGRATVTLHFGQGAGLVLVLDEPCQDSERARRSERIICRARRA